MRRPISGFVKFAEIGTAVVICHVLALAVGGIKHAWLTAIFGVILSLAAGGRRRHGSVDRRACSGSRRHPAAPGAHLLLSLRESV